MQVDLEVLQLQLLIVADTSHLIQVGYQVILTTEKGSLVFDVICCGTAWGSDSINLVSPQDMSKLGLGLRWSILFELV
jgi:hypothetical protein